MTNFTAGQMLFAADNESGAEVPLMKQTWGASGSAVRVDMSTPLPMQPGTGVKFNIGTRDWRMSYTTDSVAVYQQGTFNVVAAQGANPYIVSGTIGAYQVGTWLTKDVKDAGRNLLTLGMASAVQASATESLQSLTGYSNGAQVAGNTTPAVVTSGKTFRAQSLTVTYVAKATAGLVAVRLRAKAGAIVDIASPIVGTWIVGAEAAVAGISNTITIPLPDGMEFAAGTGLGITAQGLDANGFTAASGLVHVQLTGYEY